MVEPYRDEFALPLQTQREPSRAPAYIVTVSAGAQIDESRISGEVDGMEAVRQAVFTILHTERYSYAMNYPNEGVELQQFIGMPFSYFYAKIAQVVSDAVMQDNRVLDVRILRKEQPAPRVAFCEVEVQSVHGTMRHGFSIPLVR